MPEFQDLEKLGSGGFGVVWKCRTEAAEGEFARKVLNSRDPDALKRFQREVRILTKLNHPLIVRVIASQLEEPPYWYLMPIYQHSLRALFPDVVANRSRITTIFLQVLEGIEYAHEQGIIHRDLKPENILMNSDSDLVVSDFGLGLDVDAETTRRTTAGQMLGTFGYMAPEQLGDAKHATPHSDIFSLGRILHELFTGDRPGTVQNLAQLPVGIKSIVERCTQNDPARRFQSVRELRESFELATRRARKTTSRNDVDNLVAEIIASDVCTEEQARQLADLIAEFQEEKELLHDIAVKLPSAGFTALHATSREVTVVLVTQFRELAISQGWPFEYTDRIGEACERIYQSIEDPEIRALVSVAVRVGVDHNRWDVMRIAGRLIQLACRDEDARAIAHALEPLEGDIRVLTEGDYVNPKTLHPAIRELFELQ